MIETGSYRLPVRVMWHVNGGCTRVEHVDPPGHLELPWWDIQTETIPPDLRKIGSEFWLVLKTIRPEHGDAPDTLRRMATERASVERRKPSEE